MIQTQLTRVEFLREFCEIANSVIRKEYGCASSCIYSTAVVCDVLNAFGFNAKPLRVEACVLNDAGVRAVSLGWSGDGGVRKKAEKGMWSGHLVTLLDDRYLIDTTLDQVNENNPQLEAQPVVIDLNETEWNTRGSTGNLYIFENSQTWVRYKTYHKQWGWKNAGDFRCSGRRQELVQDLIQASRGRQPRLFTTR